MGWLLKLLTFPVSGPLSGSRWVIEQVAAEADRQLFDEDAIRAQLAELEARYETGDIDEETLEHAEDELLERLRVARARQDAGGRQQPHGT